MLDLKNKKVLVTGAVSMINSQIVKKLKLRGAIVDPVYHNQTDLLSESAVNDRFNHSKPDYLIHGATYSGNIKFNLALPQTVFYRSTLMGMNVLNAASSHKVKKVVCLLTSCGYPGNISGMLSEDQFLMGRPHETVACHGDAKRALFLYGQMTYKQYGMPCHGVIFNNCYGEETFDLERTKVLGSLIKKIKDAKAQNKPEIIIWGSGQPRREFLHAEDAAEGAIQVLESYDDINLPLNIGWGTDQTILELAEKIKRLSEYDGNLVLDLSKPDGQMQKLLNVDRMKKLLQWKPQIDLETGILKTIWYYDYITHKQKFAESYR